jgi:hypothetical protein
MQCQGIIRFERDGDPGQRFVMAKERRRVKRDNDLRRKNGRKKENK